VLGEWSSQYIADLVSAINQNTYLPAMADDIHLARLAPESPARAPTGFLGEKVRGGFGDKIADHSSETTCQPVCGTRKSAAKNSGELKTIIFQMDFFYYCAL